MALFFNQRPFYMRQPSWNLDVMRPGWNFFDEDLPQSNSNPESELMGMRRALDRLIPRDFAVQGHAQAVPKCLEESVVVENDERKLKLRVNVAEFRPDEVKVKILENNVLQVTAHHEDRTENGFNRSTFQRLYKLPKGTNCDSIRPVLTKDGVLVVEAQLPQLQAKNERVLPIQFEGAVGEGAVRGENRLEQGAQ